MMLSITAVLESHLLGLCILLGAPAGSKISRGRNDFSCGSAVLLMVSEGLEIELSDFEAENAMLKGE